MSDNEDARPSGEVEQTDPVEALTDAIAELEAGDQNGVPVGEVVEEMLGDRTIGLGEVGYALREAAFHGVVYQPSDETVARVATDGGENRGNGTARDTVDAFLSVADADCEVSSFRLVDCDDRRLTLQLTEDGLREFITELRLQEYDTDAAAWLADHSTADMTTLSGGETDD